MAFDLNKFRKEADEEIKKIVAEEVEERAKQAIRLALFFLASSSPIWTGQYQSNHRIGVGRPDERVEGIPSAKNNREGLGELAISPAEVMVREEGKLEEFKLGDSIFISNSTFQAGLVEDRYAMYERAGDLMDDWLSRDSG